MNSKYAIERISERTANAEIYELREKIKAIGPISATAAEDFEQEKERMLSVESQYNDLSKARDSLATAMERLDTVARDRFLDTFRKIQRNYNDIFTSLMPGGEAMLAMQSDLDPLEAEIEINARPTGKKMRGVRALSGEERALTATLSLLRRFSHQTQFVVITHNKRDCKPNILLRNLRAVRRGNPSEE